MMLFIMSMNRYFAIVKPLKYKRYFKKSNVKIIISFITVLCSLFFISNFALFLFLALKDQQFSDYSNYTNINGTDYENFTYYDYYYDYYFKEDHESTLFVYSYFYFPVLQFSLVTINSILMLYVYTSIGKSFKINLMRLCCKFDETPSSLMPLKIKGASNHCHQATESIGNTGRLKMDNFLIFCLLK